jgi:UbiD family decarboxylase
MPYPECPNSLRAWLKKMPIIQRTSLMPLDAIAMDYARRYSGPPARGNRNSEPLVRYVSGTGQLPVLLGCFGDETEVRHKLKLTAPFNTASVRRLIARAEAPVLIPHEQLPPGNPHFQHLRQLPVLTHTPNDAGAYITSGFVYCHSESGTDSLSAHRLWLLDRQRLALSILPGRQLEQIHQQYLASGRPLPVSINIGIPPAAAIAASLSGGQRVPGQSKLELAAALAASPVRLCRMQTQAAVCLADSEIILEGTLGVERINENAAARYSMPEFTGYVGKAGSKLAVFTLSKMRVRQEGFYPALIGPGREQSVLLGLAGMLNALLGLPENLSHCIADLRYAHSGGGMLLLYVALYSGFNHHARLQELANALLAINPFTKLIVFVDEDINLQADEDVLWAMTTRCRLELDCHSLSGYPALRMDPVQATNHWRGTIDYPPQRIWINATIPYGLQCQFQRAYGELT